MASAGQPSGPDSGTGPRQLDDPGFRLLLIGLAAIGPFSLNIFKPCLPWIKADFGAPITTVQLGLSLSIFASAVATVLSGPVADTLGRRPVAVASAYLYVLSSALGAMAPTVAVLIGARVVQAASSSVALVVARTLIHDRRQDVQRTMARVALLAVGGVLLAPALGGVLIDAIGWRAVFGLTSLLGLLLLVPVHRTLRETSPRSAGRSPTSELSGHLRRLLASPVFYGYAVQSSLHFAIFFAFSSAAAYLMVDVLGRPASEYGLWFFVLALLVGAGLGAAERLSGRVRSGVLACFGSALVMLGCGAVGWLQLASGLALSPVMLFAPATVAAFGVGLAVPGTHAGVMQAAPELAGTASGLLGFLQFAAAAVFAQFVVQDEPSTAQVLGVLVLKGGVVGFAFSLLSARHGAVKSDPRPNVASGRQ